MPVVHTLDLRFQNTEEAIAAYLIETSEGPVLVESGPETTFIQLESCVKAIGYDLRDIRHLFLTHIHFDHAGAAWKLAANGTKIYVHPAGLPHLHAPDKLWQSARQIYKDQMDVLWGDMQPIDSTLLVPADDGDEIIIGDTKIRVIYTPGHAVHHNAYKVGDVIFTGDVAGVKIENGPVVPPCPPPDINIELWKESIKKLRGEKARILYLTHFAGQEFPDLLLNELEAALDDWSGFIAPYYNNGTTPEELTPLFMAYVKTKYYDTIHDEKVSNVYEYANPSWMSVNGLLRYWKLKEQGRI